MTNNDMRTLLGNCSTEVWFKAEHARPKEINVSFTRTKNGYIVKQASIKNQVNQHTTKWVRADARALVRDMKRRGMTSK